MRKRTSLHGFTLVELSIVLVILGLLVGGVLTGQSLIRAAELRSVSTEYQRWVAASQAFRDKYFALPGDMTNATSFWGAAHATPATCLTTVGTGTQTCNGDGDGVLDFATLASQRGEHYTFWQHLANAGLIEGSYTGMSGSSGWSHATETNGPRGKIGTSALWIILSDSTSSAMMFPVAVARHNYRLGVATTSWPAGKLLTPSEQWNIDTKLDDGLPGQGIVTGSPSSYVTLPSCASTSSASTAVYNLSLSAKECVIFIAAGF